MSIFHFFAILALNFRGTFLLDAKISLKSRNLASFFENIMTKNNIIPYWFFASGTAMSLTVLDIVFYTEFRRVEFR